MKLNGTNMAVTIAIRQSTIAIVSKHPKTTKTHSINAGKALT